MKRQSRFRKWNTNTVQQTLGITKKNNLGYFTQSAHDCFKLMFRNEHRSNFFFACHVIESHFKEESLLTFLAKKLICIGEKFVPQTGCLSSEVNKYIVELSFRSLRNILLRRAQNLMSAEICKNEIDDDLPS